MSIRTPIILLCGNAGSGKDTVAEKIAHLVRGTVTIGQADLLKQFAKRFFSFTDGQLFGPSEARNAVDPRFADRMLGGAIYSIIDTHGENWIREVWPGRSENAYTGARIGLNSWASKTLAHGYTSGGLSARYVLQTLGTEWGRATDPNIWTEHTSNTALKLLGGGHAYGRSLGLTKSKEAVNLVVVTDGRFRNEIVNFQRNGAYVVRIENPDDTALQAGVEGHQSETELTGIPDHWFDMILVNDKRHGLYALDTAVDDLLDNALRVRSATTDTRDF